jgi:curli biogenesis system outer membrane secretion channel CsgG
LIWFLDSILWSIVAAVAGLSGAGFIAIGDITAMKVGMKKSGKVLRLLKMTE